MVRVIFFEKPGCGGNARQKALLRQSGHELDVRDLLTNAWNEDLLRSFFGARPVSQWFNAASPRVKLGEINPQSLKSDEALALMLGDPLLIRRPLMEVDGRRQAGFDPDEINAWIGLRPTATPVAEGCPREVQTDAARRSTPTRDA